VARLSGGALGTAFRFDLAQYQAARKDAMAILQAGAGNSDHSALFRTTETYRAGAEGRDKTERLVRTLYALLEDLMFLHSGTSGLVRNQDIVRDLQDLAGRTDFNWVAAAAQRLGEVESGMRRNLLRNLSLDAFAISLEEGTERQL
jgi:DNA polymerase-3 subunit delta'